MFNYQKECIAASQKEWKEKILNKVSFDVDDAYGVEDCLSMHEVFFNGMSGKPCHSDSYMTCLKYSNLDKAIKELDVPSDLVTVCLNYWETNPNMQPPLKQVARIWRQTLETK